MKKFKKSLELNKQFVNNISSEELELLMSEFDKYKTMNTDKNNTPMPR